jgi:sialate O-acetylesterase
VLRTTPEGRYYLERFQEKIDTTAPGELPRNYRDPGANFYGMIKPLIPYGIKGVIWYQGENNVFEYQMYRNSFETMVTDWRTEWGEGDFPFYFVQLAPYRYSKEVVGAALRDAQRRSLDIPNTGMAVTLDIGNPGNIHPTNKRDVGKRLSLWALARTYGKGNVAYSGPIYESMKIEGRKIRIHFTYADSGLYCKGDKLTCFTIAGNDKVFHQADAVIDGSTILVSSDEVKKPAAARFAFENTDVPNLFNKEGLPASTFRTDNWDIIAKTPQ